MFKNESELLYANKDQFAEEISNWVQEHYPNRTTYYDKCSRDVRYVIQALVYCLDDGNFSAMEHMSTMFYTKGILQLKTTEVEFKAYDMLLEKIKDLFKDEFAAVNHCNSAIMILKGQLTKTKL